MGLSIGVSGVLALLFSIYAYYTADDCIPNRQDIVYLKTILKDGSAYREVPYPLLDQLIETSADVVSGTHLHSWGNIWLELAGKDFQHRTDYADPEFFKVFDLPLKFGNSDTALKEKFFGREAFIFKSLDGFNSYIMNWGVNIYSFFKC